MFAVKSPLGEEARTIVGDALQGALVDLIDLSLTAKQAHWNLVGPRFRSVHLQLDEVVQLARKYTDIVAERSVAIGMPADGRAVTVAKESGLPHMESGPITDERAIATFVDILTSAIGRMRRRIEETATADPVSQDILLDLAADLEKQSWMWQAENTSGTNH